MNFLVESSNTEFWQELSLRLNGNDSLAEKLARSCINSVKYTRSTRGREFLLGLLANEPAGSLRHDTATRALRVFDRVQAAPSLEAHLLRANSSDGIGRDVEPPLLRSR